MAQEEPRWFADPSDRPRAKWGIPETDAVGFEVECLPGDTVAMRPALFAMAEPAAVPDIRFVVDGENFVRDAELAYSERDSAWQGWAKVDRGDALIDAIRRGNELTYDFQPPLRDGDAFTLSLTGSARAIDEALEGC